MQALLQHLYQRAGRLAGDGGPVLDCWQYPISEGQDVVIVTYGCYVASTTPPVVSNEHERAGLFTHDEVPDLNMPDGARWWARRQARRRAISAASSADLAPLECSPEHPPAPGLSGLTEYLFGSWRLTGRPLTIAIAAIRSLSV